jgi:hypothetical protein
MPQLIRVGKGGTSWYTWPSLFADFYLQTRLLISVKMVLYDNFLVKKELFICEFKIRGPNLHTVSTANNEGNLYCGNGLKNTAIVNYIFA